MLEHQHLPDLNKISVLSASIFLAYALIPFLNFQTDQITISLPFIVLYFNLGFTTIVSFFVAALAAIGTIWLVQSHPHLESSPLRHAFLPALTAWGLSIPLSNLDVGLQWWAVFGLGGILLILVFVAEYIAVDFSDIRHVLATIGLTAISFAFFLILAISSRAAGLRLYLLLPALYIPLFLAILRTLYLRTGGRWCLQWTIAITLVVAQLSIGLQYIPVSPLSYGLFLLGLAYALTSLASAIEEGRSFPALLTEPVIMLAVTWFLAFIFQR